jgi:type II secretory pathway pseudopilin PulG
VKCQPCGQDNASSALFCTACRRPLVAPSKLPTRLEPLAQPAMAMAAPAMATAYGGAADAASPRNRFAPPEAVRASRMGGDAEILTQEEAWSAVIGDSNSLHYLGRFERLAHGEGSGWHWPAFFITWFWMLYRKMWVPAGLYVVAYFAVSIFVSALQKASPILAGLVALAWMVFWLIGPSLFANRWYYNHCVEKIRVVRARGGSKEQMLARMEAAGGTSNIAVIVLAILVIGFIGIGILAAIALPAYQTYTVKAKVADAMPVADEVTAAVGRQYEQTGTLPSQADVDAIVRHAAHPSKYVNGVDLDDVHGTVTLRIATGPHTEGSIQYVLGSDNNRHPSWTCTSPADMRRYVPASCRGEGAPAR